nr:YdbH domain-containing protein [Azospirillum sp. SYSU D00513]
MTLKPDGPGPAQLLPGYGAQVSKVSGRLAAKARLDWNAKGLRSGGELLLEEVAGTAGPVSLAGVNGAIRLSSLSPPVIPAGQVLAVKLLDVGVPLTDGTVTFGYGRDGRLNVEGAEWRWAGGLLRASPFVIAPAEPRGIIELHAERIDLGRMLELVAVDGLAATGRLSGRLPVSIVPERVSLDGGLLEAVEPGTLRYDPAEPPGFLQGDEGSPTALLMGALTDFRYSELRATLDGEAGGELRIGFGILGSNPAFYDGYPVKLNLNVSGALDRILRQSLDAYRIPDTVRDRMSEFGRKDP